jgi:chromosome segregation ATPase
MVVNDRTVIDLQILGRNIVDLRAAVGRLEREVEALTLAYREVKGDIAGIDLQLRTMIGLADKRHADNLAEFGALHRELDTLRDKVAELHGEVAELRAGQQELRGEVGELRAGQQELRGEVAELRAGQQATDRSIASLTAMIVKIHEKLGI